MKYIISALEDNIEFLLSKGRKITIDTIVPTQVTDSEFLILKERLGNNIKEKQIAGISTPVDSSDSEVESADEELNEAETPVVETPQENQPEVESAV